MPVLQKKEPIKKNLFKNQGQKITTAGISSAEAEALPASTFFKSEIQSLKKEPVNFHMQGEAGNQKIDFDLRKALIYSVILHRPE